MKAPELFGLTGKVAVVTGGARTLGYDMAEALAEAGCDVIITSRDRASAEKSAQQLAAQCQVAALGLALDQREAAQVAAFAEQAFAWKGRVDILVNNAGGGKSNGTTQFFDRKPEDVADMIHVNLTAVLVCCQEFGKRLAVQKSGVIINIASVAGMVGRDRRMYQRTGLAPQAVDYAAAKGGLIAATRDLAAVLAPYHVRVNAISPGGFTGPKRNMLPAFAAAYGDRTPLGRMGRDGLDLKGAVLFLASPASDYVTGHNLAVDGGFTAWQ